MRYKLSNVRIFVTDCPRAMRFYTDGGRVSERREPVGPDGDRRGGMLAHLRDPDGNVITLVGSAD